MVSGFAGRLADDARLALVVFDQKADLALGLTRADRAAFAEGVNRALERVIYRGQLTDTAAGFERGVYELRQQGREEAAKVIVLLTDSLVDVGAPAKNLERQRWLQDALARQADRLDIQAFGIALTLAADSQLMQSLAEGTDGDYYQLQSAVDIGRTFDQIFDEIRELTKPPEPEPAVAEVTPAEAPRGVTAAVS